jgi:hypothetical protein
MVSKEEYKKYVSELTENDKNNANLKYLSKGYKTSSIVMTVLGFLTIPIGIGIIFLIMAIVGIVKANNAEKYYKTNYSKKILDFLFKDNEYTFDEQGKIDERKFRDSQIGLRRNYDYYRGEDLLTINIPNDDGSRSNNNLNLCDLKVTKIEGDDDGGSREVNVYSGVFGYVDFPFQFKCSMSINTNYRKYGVKFEKVSLEDIVFNKKFDVHSNDQVEARYILTPEMMEKLMELNKKIGKIYLVIVDNKMYFGFPGIDLFELKKVNNVENLFDDFYNHVSIILSIVNEIKSNNKVFKM